MTTASERRERGLAAAGVLVALPALYFVTANLVKYELGLYPALPVYPFSPFIVLGGLLLAVALNLYPIVQAHVSFEDQVLAVSLRVRMQTWNGAVVAVGALYLGILGAYLVVENLVPH